MIVGAWLALAAIALVVGCSIGTVGVGGVLLIPSLVWLGGLTIHRAAATALFSFFFTGIACTWLFQRRGSIGWAVTRPVVVGALIFSYLGARVNAMVNARSLTLIIALIIVCSGTYILLPTRPRKTGYRDGRSGRQQWVLLFVGMFAGFGSGLSGAGGPLFSVPMLLVLGFMPLTAIGASQVLQIVAALFGTVGNLQYGSIDFRLAGWLILFELVGTLAGARVAHAASATLLRRLAAGLCVATGIIMLARSL